jgi:hypothetical protein
VNGGELEQIQFLLGHASVLTTERYLGCKQNLEEPVNDRFGCFSRRIWTCDKACWQQKNSGRKVSNLHLGCRKLQRTSASEAVLLSSGGSSGLELRNVNGGLLAGVLDRNANRKEVSFNPGRGEHPQDAAA